ncbi:MAG TPA: hypothetical protein VMT82_03275 [candidate division Zixibacteria bacterium]|nr:hypothetical protein [candidate division Zixibacteria bacterium]
MQFWRKLVSLGLLMVVIALPLVAMATCAPESAKPMHCCKKCATMAKMHGGMKHPGQNAKGTRDKSAPCCDIKNSQTAPIAEYQAVAPVVLAAPTASLLAVAETPQPTSALIAEADPAPPPPDSQARLCTFQN